MSLSHDKTTQEYIEIIHDLERDNKVARVKDIAERRGVTRSSVSLALNQLLKKDLIRHEQYGYVSLTDQGHTLAMDLEHKHVAIKRFLTFILGIEETLADEDACILEHHVSNVTLDAFTEFVKFIEECPFGSIDTINKFKKCQKEGKETDE